jgi:hypothetical protein
MGSTKCVTIGRANGREDGTLEVLVHQIAKDMMGKVLFDGHIKHIYTFKESLIQKMVIEKVD